MYIKFYEAPNQELVSSIMFEHSLTEIDGLIQAYPQAMLAMIDVLPEMPKTENEFAADEKHRLALNNIIRIAEELESLLTIVLGRKTIFDKRLFEESFQEAIMAFRRLQKIKLQRITRTHEELGEHFGSMTGFQMCDYNDVANKIESWLAAEVKEIT